MVAMFITLPLPDHARNAVLAARRQLAARLPDGVPLENQRCPHLTLRYLGEVTAGQLRQLKPALQALPQLPIILALSPDLGAFPDVNRPRTIFSNLEGDLHRLGQLRRHIDLITQEAQLPPADHPLKPHVTLGTVSDRSASHIARALLDTRIPGASQRPWRVAGLYVLASTGYGYQTVAEIPWPTAEGENAR